MLFFSACIPRAKCEVEVRYKLKSREYDLWVILTGLYFSLHQALNLIHIQQEGLPPIVIAQLSIVQPHTLEACRHLNVTVKVNRHSKLLLRPLTVRTLPRGFSKYISHSRRYRKDQILFQTQKLFMHMDFIPTHYRRLCL